MKAADIADGLAGRVLDVCRHLFPAGRRNGDEYEVGDVTGAPGRSLRINVNGKAGVWADFATGDKGDLLDLWRAARGLTISEAMREAAEWLGEPLRRPDRYIEDGIPAEAPAGHPKWKGTPSGRWCYTTADSKPWLVVYRYDKADATKVFFTYDMQAGKWCKSAEHRLPGRRPLYRLGSFAQRPAGEIVLAEGEKCAEALARLGFDATSTLGGCGQIRQADFTPLRDWRVRIWADADDAGRKFAETAAAMLHAVGAEPLMVPIPADVPDGWDVADAVRNGWGIEEIKAQLEMAEPCGVADSTPDGFDIAAHLRPLSEVVVVPHRYLWEPYLPLGKLSLLAGDWETWKSWLALVIASAGSQGWGLPDRDTGKPGGQSEPWSTLYLTNENDPETLRFRVDRLGGDPNKVIIWNTAVSQIPTFAELAKLDAALHHAKPRLMVVDPIQSALGHELNMDKTNQVRAVLDAVAALAAKHDVSALTLMHLNKSTTQSAKHRIMSSVDFGAAPRSILVSAPDPVNPACGVLAHLKCSIDRKGTSLCFEVANGGGGVEFGWKGPSDLTADDLLCAAPRSDRTDTQVDAAIDFLREFLAGGAHTREAVTTAAGKRNIATAALKRAATKLRVRYGTFGFPKRTTWELPK